MNNRCRHFRNDIVCLLVDKLKCKNATITNCFSRSNNSLKNVESFVCAGFSPKPSLKKSVILNDNFGFIQLKALA